LLDAKVLHRVRGGAQARLVEQHVEASPRFLYPCKDSFYFRRLGNVGRQRHRPVAGAGVGSRLVEQLLAAADERDAIAVLEHRQGRRLADSRAGAGDQRDLVRHVRSSFWLRSKNGSTAASKRSGCSRLTRWPATSIM